MATLIVCYFVVRSWWIVDALPPLPATITRLSFLVFTRTPLVCFVIPARLAETVLMVALYEWPSNTCFSFCMDAAFLHGNRTVPSHSKPLPQPWRYIYNSCSHSPSCSPSPSPSPSPSHSHSPRPSPRLRFS